MKKVAVLLFGIAMFFIGAMVSAGEWTVDTPETGMYVFRNETGTFKGTTGCGCGRIFRWTNCRQMC